MVTAWCHCTGNGSLGNHMMSLRWRQLPWLLSWLKLTGKKGLVIWPVPGNVPINGNKEETFIYIFMFQGGLLVIQRPLFFFWSNMLRLSCFPLACVILLACLYCWMLSWISRHNKMEKSYVVLWFCVRWVPTFCCCLIFPVWCLLSLWWIAQPSCYPSRCQRYSNGECHMPEFAPGSVCICNLFPTSFLPFPTPILSLLKCTCLVIIIPGFPRNIQCERWSRG